MDRYIDRQTDRQTSRQTDEKISRHIDRQTDKVAPRGQFGPKALAESTRNLRARKIASQADPRRRPTSNHILSEATAKRSKMKTKSRAKPE